MLKKDGGNALQSKQFGGRNLKFQFYLYYANTNIAYRILLIKMCHFEMHPNLTNERNSALMPKIVRWYFPPDPVTNLHRRNRRIYKAVGTVHSWMTIMKTEISHGAGQQQTQSGCAAKEGS